MRPLTNWPSSTVRCVISRPLRVWVRDVVLTGCLLPNGIRLMTRFDFYSSLPVLVPIQIISNPLFNAFDMGGTVLPDVNACICSVCLPMSGLAASRSLATPSLVLLSWWTFRASTDTSDTGFVFLVGGSCTLHDICHRSTHHFRWLWTGTCRFCLFDASAAEFTLMTFFLRSINNCHSWWYASVLPASSCVVVASCRRTRICDSWGWQMLFRLSWVTSRRKFLAMLTVHWCSSEFLCEPVLYYFSMGPRSIILMI